MNNISLWEILYPQKLRTNRIYKIMKITLTLVFVSIFSMFAGNIVPCKFTHLIFM